MEKESVRQIGFTILGLVEEYAFQEKKARYYGTDTQIYNAEIHTVACVIENPGIHVGGIASQMNITKSSVSEILSKLDKKGLIKKVTDESNLSKLSVYATEKGTQAHLQHMKYHSNLDKLIAKHVAGLSP